MRLKANLHRSSQSLRSLVPKQPCPVVIAMISLLKVLGLVPLALAAPILNERADNTVPGKYIVVYKQDVNSVAEAAKGYTGDHPLANLKREQTYQLGTFKGFSALLSQDQLSALQTDSRVSGFSCRIRAPNSPLKH